MQEEEKEGKGGDEKRTTSIAHTQVSTPCKSFLGAHGVVMHDRAYLASFFCMASAWVAIRFARKSA